ncbi:MAG: hypothetical protein RR482_10250 [Clostridia bacterium]
MDDRMEIEGQINGLKNLLSQTDYKAIKHADGALTNEEYAATRAKRDEWRAEINRLELLLEALPANDPQ